MGNSKNSPLSIIAFGIAISIGIVAAGFAISLLVSSVGLAIGVGSGTQILNDLFSVWVTRLAGVGLAAGGATVFIKTVVDSREKIIEKPKQWVIPILAIAAGFLVEVDKTFVAEGIVTKILFSSISVLMIYVGSVVFERKGKAWKSCGVFLIFMPPTLV
jgi:hypothetical protein